MHVIYVNLPRRKKEILPNFISPFSTTTVVLIYTPMHLRGEELRIFPFRFRSLKIYYKSSLENCPKNG